MSLPQSGSRPCLPVSECAHHNDQPNGGYSRENRTVKRAAGQILDSSINVKQRVVALLCKILI
jgi:hypothetical protein